LIVNRGRDKVGDKRLGGLSSGIKGLTWEKTEEQDLGDDGG
jgi:hypothetical protein